MHCCPPTRHTLASHRASGKSRFAIRDYKSSPEDNVAQIFAQYFVYGLCALSMFFLALLTKKCEGGPPQPLFINSIVNFLQTTPWCKLLSHIGDSLMIFLLLSTTMFFMLENKNYVQLTGPPVSRMEKLFYRDISKLEVNKHTKVGNEQVSSSHSDTSRKRRRPTSWERKRKQKRHKVNPVPVPVLSTQCAKSTSTAVKGWLDITQLKIDRKRIFFSHSCFTGLSPGNVLNFIATREEKVRALARSIFGVPGT